MNSKETMTFEKWALSILALVIVGLLAWVGNTVNNNQIQYARIEVTLTSNSLMLVDMKTKFENAVQWRSAIATEQALIKQRLSVLEAIE
jgi:hypothetical protein